MSQEQSNVLKTVSVIGVFAIAFTLGYFTLSAPAYAVNKQGNDECKGGWDPACDCGKKMNPQSGQCEQGENKKDCTCTDTTNGQPTRGKCKAPGECKAESSSGSGVDSALSQLGQLLGKAMEALKGGGGGGGGGGGQPPGGGGGGGGGGEDKGSGTGSCTTFYQVSTPSSDPCAQYVPPATSAAGTDLLNALGPNTPSNPGTPSGTTILSMISNPDSLVLNNATGTASTTAYSFFDQAASQTAGSSQDFTQFSNIANIISDNGGGLQVGANGATISSSQQNAQYNTAVSGFFGADSSFGGGPGGIAAWLCQTRPWANGIVSTVVSATFFDNLCTQRGYRVGLPPAAAPVLTQTSVHASYPTTPASTTSHASTTTPVEPPHVQIWAVPAAVSIGSRTSVFWNTRGVANCTETSPDGSFQQTSLSGGASTVPLTAATTFTISCLAPDGTPVTDYFTVRMAI